MSIMADLVVGLGGIVVSLITIYTWVIIIAALVSWVRPDPYNPIVQVLSRLSEPAYRLVRRYIPTMFNGIDLAPLVIIIGLKVIEILLVALLNALAAALA